MAPGRKAPPAAEIALDLTVEAGDWPAKRSLKALAVKAIAAAAAHARPPLAPSSELSLVFTDDAAIRVLNKAHRHKDAATNVLSFPAAPPVRGRFGPLLGDIVLADATIGREAADTGITLRDHLTHLIVHGFLHLVGYDHMKDDEAAVMEQLETAILASLGIDDPYAEHDVQAERATRQDR